MVRCLMIEGVVLKSRRYLEGCMFKSHHGYFTYYVVWFDKTLYSLSKWVLAYSWV